MEIRIGVAREGERSKIGGRDLDAVLHVNPDLKEKGLLLVFNPTDRTISKALSVPLYYAGLTDAARVREQEGTAKSYRLDRTYGIALDVRVEAGGFTWFVIE